jgi:hypothetical protein
VIIHIHRCGEGRVSDREERPRPVFPMKINHLRSQPAHSRSARQYQREAEDYCSSKRLDARVRHAWRVEQAIGGSFFVLPDVARLDINALKAPGAASPHTPRADAGR